MRVRRRRTCLHPFQLALPRFLSFDQHINVLCKENEAPIAHSPAMRKTRNNAMRRHDAAAGQTREPLSLTTFACCAALRTSTSPLSLSVSVMNLAVNVVHSLLICSNRSAVQRSNQRSDTIANRPLNSNKSNNNNNMATSAK